MVELQSINALLIFCAILIITIFVLLSFLFLKQKKYLLHRIFLGISISSVPVLLIGIVDRLFLGKYLQYTEVWGKYGMKSMSSPIPMSTVFDDALSGGQISILDTQIPNLHLSFASIRNALDRGVKIRILVVHPEGIVTKFRAKEMGIVWDYERTFRPGVYSYINHFQAIIKEDVQKRSGLIELRYYEDLPCMPFYMIDNSGDDHDKIYQGYFLSSASVEIPNVEIVRTTNGMYTFFEKYFQEKWDRNKDNIIDLMNFNGQASLPPPRYVEIFKTDSIARK